MPTYLIFRETFPRRRDIYVCKDVSALAPISTGRTISALAKNAAKEFAIFPEDTLTTAPIQLGMSKNTHTKVRHRSGARRMPLEMSQLEEFRKAYVANAPKVAKAFGEAGLTELLNEG